MEKVRECGLMLSREDDGQERKIGGEEECVDDRITVFGELLLHIRDSIDEGFAG